MYMIANDIILASRGRLDSECRCAEFGSVDRRESNLWGGSCWAALRKSGDIREVGSLAGQAVRDGPCHEHVRHRGGAGTDSRRAYYRYASTYLAVLLLVSNLYFPPLISNPDTSTCIPFVI